MDERWYMLLENENDAWTWCAVDADGTTVKCAEQSFSRYLDAYEDARLHGCSGTPGFAVPEAPGVVAQRTRALRRSERLRG